MGVAPANQYAIVGPDHAPVNAKRYGSMTEATLALLFEYARELDYRVKLLPPTPEDPFR